MGRNVKQTPTIRQRRAAAAGRKRERERKRTERVVQFWLSHADPQWKCGQLACETNCPSPHKITAHCLLMPTISRASSTPSPRWPGCYKLHVIQLHSRTERLPNITARLAWHLASGAATGIARAPHLDMGNLNGLLSHELRYIEAF